MVCPLLSLLAPWVPALLLVLQLAGLAAFAGFAFARWAIGCIVGPPTIKASTFGTLSPLIQALPLSFSFSVRFSIAFVGLALSLNGGTPAVLGSVSASPATETP